jgi:PAS domain S-box-containing protein
MKSIATQPLRERESGTIQGKRSCGGSTRSRNPVEERWLRSEEKFDKIFHTSPDSISITSMTDGRFTDVNESFCRVTGFSRKETIGRTVAELGLYSDPGDRRRLVDQLNRQGRVTGLEIKGRMKSGDLKYYLVSAEIIELLDGKYILSLMHDNTESRRTAEVLRESEKKHRDFADQLPQIVCEIDSVGRIVFANQDAFKAFGYSPQDLESGLTVWQMIEPKDLGMAKQNMWEALNGVDPGGVEYSAVRRDGRIFPLLTYSRPIIDAGHATGLRLIAVDMTERKTVENQLRQSEERLSKVFRTIPDSVTVSSVSDGRLMEVNDGFLRITGYSREEVVGRTIVDLNLWKNPLDRDRLVELLQEKGRVVDLEADFRVKSGAVINCLISAEMINLQQEKCLLAVIKDITERKRAQEFLKESYDKVRTALQSSVDIAAKMVDMKDPYTAGHQRRVAKLAMAVAREMKMEEDTVTYLGLAAKVHDIGKINVPAEILNKTGRLTNIEFQLMMTHSQAGHDILNGVDFPWPLAKIVLQHHERMDGSGYPKGLRGEEIMLEARIIAVADTVEAMSGHRPYRPSLGVKEALDEIKAHKDVLYDGKVVEACLRVMGNGRVSLDD